MLFSNRIDAETCNLPDTCLADTYSLPATSQAETFHLPTEASNLPNNKPATCPTELCNLPNRTINLNHNL